MAELRNAKIKNIYNNIEESKKFSLNDFKIEFPNKGKVLVKILFKKSGDGILINYKL